MNDLERAESGPVPVELPQVQIPKGEVLKRMGYPSASFDPGEPVKSVFREALEEAGSLMRPAAAFRILRIASNDGKAVRFHGDEFSIASGQVAKLLARSEAAACFCATVGGSLDEAISLRMRNGDMLTATILDAIGSETADAAADELHWKILKRLSDSVTARFSPGYGDWPLTVQEEMIRVSGGALIGITVTPSSLMIPRKSVSAILGINISVYGSAAGGAVDGAAGGADAVIPPSE
jgi:hypothetical protein